MEDNKKSKKQDKAPATDAKKVVDEVKAVKKETAQGTPVERQAQVTNGKEEGRGGSKERGARTDNKSNRSNQFRRGENRVNRKQDRRGRGRSRSGGRFERSKPEFDQKIINIRRVTRVMAGGRRFSFSVAVVAGNRNGKVGVGVGKASDTSLAIEKAFRNAKKNMVVIKRDENLSIPHEVSARYCTSEVYIKPAKGKGIVAGSSARNVIDLAGITDISSKILSRSKNKINIARATILALSEFAE